MKSFKINQEKKIFFNPSYDQQFSLKILEGIKRYEKNFGGKFWQPRISNRFYVKMFPHCIPDGFQKGRDKGYEWVNYPGLALLDKCQGGAGNGQFSAFSARARMKKSDFLFVTFSFGLKLMGIDRCLHFVSVSTAVFVETKW